MPVVSLPPVVLRAGSRRLEIRGPFEVSFDLHPSNQFHYHENFYELCLVLRGRGEFRHGSDIFPLQPGSLFISEPRIVHEINSYATRDLGLVFFVLVIGAPDSARAETDHGGVVSAGWRELLEDFMVGHVLEIRRPELAAFWDILDEQAAGRQARTWLDNQLSLLCVGRALAVLVEGRKSPAPEAGVLAILDRAIDYILRHTAPTPTVREVASHAGTSERTLRRLFQQERGSTVVRAIAQAKIRKAEQLFLDGHSCAEVARTVGVEDPGQFSRLFRLHMGESPSQFRQRLLSTRPAYRAP